MNILTDIGVRNSEETSIFLFQEGEKLHFVLKNYLYHQSNDVLTHWVSAHTKI